MSAVPASQERVEPCSMCGERLARWGFSKAQWRRGPNRRCPPCIEKIEATGPLGAVAARDHQDSLGLVDGKWHHAPGRKVRDRARRSAAKDKAAADATLAALKARFKLLGDSVDAIVALGYNPESFKLFQQMEFVDHVDAVLEPEHERDFLTTVRSPEVKHLAFVAESSLSKDDFRPMGTFADSPLMSQGADLKFSCTQRVQHFISSMPAGCVVRHEGGTVLMRDGVLHGARCSEQVCTKITTELINCYAEMEKYREFLQRGVEVANVCGNFVVTGFKADLNTKLYMTHNPKSDEVAFPEMQVRLRLKRLFIRWIYPIVRREFGWLFEPIIDAAGSFYATFVTGVTGGRVFWPRSHTDPDLWYTVLVALDVGRGVVSGGDFAFATHGHVLKCEHGDVLVYNGLMLHGTTEFHLYAGDPNSARVFFAFYMKENIVHARARSESLVSRVGRSPIELGCHP